MFSSRSLVGLSFLSLLSSSAAQLYINPDIYDTSNFFSKFNFAAGNDPTHGYVDYQSYSGAQANNLISTGSNSVIFRADGLSVPSDTARGRMSVRLEGTATYTHGLFIADIAHMPGGSCGSWPSFWTLGPSWPTNGEIDLLEQTNFETTTKYSLHTNGYTTGSCDIKSNTSQNGTLLSTGCAVKSSTGVIQNTAGCSIQSANGNSFGDNFNDVGGGVIVMQWTSNNIKVWSFQRDNIPASLQSASATPNICEFGRPDATFTGNGCNFDSNFAQQQLVFTNTFCGDWGMSNLGLD
jgi:hypothetical protein